jgi:hypothetical protein
MRVWGGEGVAQRKRQGNDGSGTGAQPAEGLRGGAGDLKIMDRAQMKSVRGREEKTRRGLEFDSQHLHRSFLVAIAQSRSFARRS